MLQLPEPRQVVPFKMLCNFQLSHMVQSVAQDLRETGALLECQLEVDRMPRTEFRMNGRRELNPVLCGRTNIFLLYGISDV